VDGYLHRWASSILGRVAKVNPAIVLMGARQTGKSTLVRSEPLFADRLYYTLDDLDTQEKVQSNIDAIVRSGPRVTLDEVQRAPELMLAVKRAIDDAPVRTPGQFVLTGSANLLLMRRVSESLAGRASYVSLWPLTRRERLGLGTCGIWSALLAARREEWYDLVRGQDVAPAEWRQEAVIGGYPVPALQLPNADERSLWFDGYVRTYLERDLQDLAAIESLVDFRRLMQAACLRLGNLVNQTELGRDAQIPRPTVHRYLDLLATSFQLVRLEPYSVNRTKRLIKAPKLYWSDTGLACHMGGGELKGAHFENLVLCDLLAWRNGLVPRPEVLFWRTASEIEVDFVIEDRDRLLPIEVKAGARVTSRDVRGLTAFRDEYPDRFVGGLLLYTGTDVRWMAEGILAAPWYKVI
jgi:predicted AAA+ superfamily ATPase